jgi:hypothetical protein
MSLGWYVEVRLFDGRGLVFGVVSVCRFVRSGFRLCLFERMNRQTLTTPNTRPRPSNSRTSTYQPSDISLQRLANQQAKHAHKQEIRQSSSKAAQWPNGQRKDTQTNQPASQPAVQQANYREMQSNTQTH